MSETWKHWDQRVVDGRFTLGKYLGGSDHSAVYETEVLTPRPRKAAIKFILRSPEDDAPFDRSQTTKDLANLLTIYGSGTCRMEEQEFSYVVMEFAEEDLSQILPERALTAEEVRGMLSPVLEVLGELHGKDLVHSRIKPSNIMAIGDQIKLSSDSLCPQGSRLIRQGANDLYVAPEGEAGAASPRGDMWSLGVTLAEALTQRPPSGREAASGELMPAGNLPEPFQTIVNGLLNPDPQKRFTVEDVKGELDPVRKASRAEKAKTAARPAASEPSPAAIAPRARKERNALRPSPVMVAGSSREEQAGKRMSPLWFLIPGLAFGAALIAWIAISRSTPTPSNTPGAIAGREESRRAAAKESSRASREPSEERSLKVPASSAAASKKNGGAPEAPSPTPAKLTEEVKPEVETGRGAKGQVLDQVLPEISEKARGTIRGTVRVSVRVHVEPSGTVFSAELDAPSASPYFADQALKAVKRWEFISPEANGRSVASDWIVRFEFSPSSTKAFPRQVTP